MKAHATHEDSVTRRHRPRTLTVFAAAFIAGAVLAYGVDRVLDIHVVQVEPQVESEPIFVALRSLPQGSPVTIWDVALKDWPKAMLPTTALKADASFDGMVLRHPIREGQPLLSVQLVRDGGIGTTTAVASLPPLPSRAAEPPRQAASPSVAGDPPAAAERFVPATPAAAVAPAGVAADATPAAPVGPSIEDTVETSPPTSLPAEGLVAVVPPPTAPGTDIDPLPPVTDAQPAEESAQPAVAEIVETQRVAAQQAETVRAAETVPVPEPLMAPESLEPTPGAPGNDALAMTAAAAPVPLAAPVPALPSTDIGAALADVGRANRGSEPPASSVLDRSTEALPAAPEQRLPKQHLVIPERIALAVDASFTQRPQQEQQQEPQQPPAAAMADESVRMGQPPVRSPAPATAAPARTGSRKPASTANAAARQPARNPRQPAAKPQAAPAAKTSPAARFWNAWFPQASGGSRQR